MAKKDDPRLFDPGPPDEKHVSELSPEEWLERHKDQLVYHGSFRSDELRRAETLHAGTERSAMDRLGVVEHMLRYSPIARVSYYYPDIDAEATDIFESLTDEEKEEGWKHVGRLHAFRLTPSSVHASGPNSGVVSDVDANSADLIHHTVTKGYEPWEVSRSIQDSSRPRLLSTIDQNSSNPIRGVIDHWQSGGPRETLTAANALKRGKAVAYKNSAEDKGSLSYVIPQSAARTWEDDVLAPGSKASTMTMAYAEARRRSGSAGSIPIQPRTPHTFEGEQMAMNFDNPDKPLYEEILKPRVPLSEIQFKTKYE